MKWQPKTCACICGWRGRRKAPAGFVGNKPCPRCKRENSVKMTKNIGGHIAQYLPMCMHCIYFERNEGFPNRSGECTKVMAGMNIVQVWDSFGCVHWEAELKKEVGVMRGVRIIVSEEE